MPEKLDGLPFGDFFSKAQFDEFFALDRLGEDSNSPGWGKWAEEWRAKLSKDFDPYLAKYLIAMRDAGVLKPIEGCRGRSGNFMDAWNVAVANAGPADKIEHAWATVAHRFAHRFMFDALYHAAEDWEKDKSLAQDACSFAYRRLTDNVTAGDVKWSKWMTEEYDFISGDRLYLNMGGWGDLRLGTLTKGVFENMKDADLERIATAEVEFRTGEMLIADWFSIPAFTAAVKKSDEFDINSEKGCRQCTAWYAEKFGFVSVCVGNTSPDIMLDDGMLVAGWFDEEASSKDRPKTLGSVTTDLWWVTMIDRSRLVEIIAKSTEPERDDETEREKVVIGPERAETMVADYLAGEYGRDVKTVKLPTGIKHLYFSGHHETFAEEFAADGVELATGVEPMFVLSDKALELKQKQEAGGPKP
jgi:hypothetical protein